MAKEWAVSSDDGEINENNSPMTSTKDRKVIMKKSFSRSISPTENLSYDNSRKSKSRSTARDVRTERTQNQPPEPCTCIGIFGLSKSTDEKSLWETFDKYGKILTVKLIMDKFQKESLGFAFINYEELDFATKAITEANGMDLDGKTIRVDYSRTKKAYTPTPGGYKGKINRRNNENNPRFENQRDFRKNYNKSRSRSPVKRHAIMKCLNQRNSPDFQRKRFPSTYNRKNSPQDCRGRSPLQDYRRRSPVQDYRRRSPVQDFRRRSPVQDYRRRSPIQDYRKRSPAQDYRRRSPVQDYHRRYSPVQDLNRKFPPQDFDRRPSPSQNYRRRSPVPAYRRHSPDQEYRRRSPIQDLDRKRYPGHESNRRTSPAQTFNKRFSPNKVNDYHHGMPMRIPNKMHSPVKHLNRRSPSPKPIYGKRSPDNNFRKGYPIANKRSYMRSKSKSY